MIEANARIVFKNVQKVRHYNKVNMFPQRDSLMSLPGGKPPKKPFTSARIIKMEAKVIPISERMILKQLLDKLRGIREQVQKVRKPAKIIEIDPNKKKE